MFNLLQERALNALQLTMTKSNTSFISKNDNIEMKEKPINQFHAQLLKQANSMPSSEKVWPQAPVKRYSWTANIK